jgi:hypothetical protein
LHERDGSGCLWRNASADNDSTSVSRNIIVVGSRVGDRPDRTGPEECTRWPDFGHAADAADDLPWDPLFVELVDPSSGSFKSASNMSTTRIHHTATRLAEGKVLLLGGIPALQNMHSRPVAPRYAEIYDPPTQTFSAPDNLAISRQKYTVTLLHTGEVLLAGGKSSTLLFPLQSC